MDVFSHSQNADLFVAGPPGSGKTTLAVLRGQFLANLNLRVLLVTRNRMLTALANQLSNNVLDCNTMHRAVASHYYRRFKEYIPKTEDPYLFDWQIALNDYQSANSSIEYDHMIVDEGQNLPPEFFVWAKRYGAHTLTVFADEDQTTDANRSSLIEIKAAGLSDPVRLTHNHRNTPEIAAVAEHFHRGKHLPPGVLARLPSSDVPELWGISAWDQLVDRVATRLSNRSESIGVIVQSIGDAKTIYALLRAAIPPQLRVNAYTNDSQTGAEYGIRLLDYGVTVLTGESAIGLEFDTVFLQDLRRSLPCMSELQYRRMYMLCARAKNALILVDGPQQLVPIQLNDLPPPDKLAR